MSDPRPIHDREFHTTPADAAADGPDLGMLRSLTQANIDEVLANSGMTIDEKRGWLAAYAGQIADRDETDRGGQFEPLEMQIRDALSMLAEGGHAYGSAEAGDIDPDERSASRLPDPNGRT